jgi:hypothetical protein
MSKAAGRERVRRRAHHNPCSKQQWWARRKSAFVLLRHDLSLRYGAGLAPQQGHLGRCFVSALTKRARTVAIEFGM